MLTSYLRSIVKATLPDKVVTRLRHRRDRHVIGGWKEQGCPLPPPPALKQMIVAEHARRFGIRTLIETGTATGEMIEAMRHVMAEIYSIEIDPGLFANATARF